MELKVWVEGIQRIVCGVTENTTCQDVVYALAHATGKTGRFTLNERWRSNERLLAPQDHPLKILMKWGEYSNDVQFILQRSQLDESKPNNLSNQTKQKSGAADPLHNFSPTSPPPDDFSFKGPDRNKDIRKSLTFSGGSQLHSVTEHKRNENIGVVKGIQKKEMENDVKDFKRDRIEDEDMSISSNRSGVSSSSSQHSVQKREAPPYRDPPGPNTGTHSPHQRALPPYRDPPPPTQSPNRNTPLTGNTSPIRNIPSVGSNSPNSYKSTTNPQNNKVIKPKRNLIRDFQNPVSGPTHAENEPFKEVIICNSQYRDLVRLVNYQREKISAQQTELTKFDAEIMYWETKAREQQRQLEFITQEKVRMENTSKQNEDQLRILAHAEEEYEIVRQQEKTLKSEISLLRSKLANCETELLQCKNKIRLLFEELQMEKRNALRETDERQHLERTLISEVEKLQNEVEQARQATEISAQCSENLKREVSMLESVIIERKRQLEQLVAEMKEANLQSLAIAPPEELKHIFEGPYKPGITRKMIGSPRQLENAVPTSKNPHGVWV